MSIPPEFDGLEKGDFIERGRLREILGGHLGHEAYMLRLTAFMKALQKRLIKLGRPYTVKFDHGRLAILDDATASDYNAKMFDNLVMRARQRHELTMAVDSTKLSDDQRKHHTRSLVIQGAIVSGMSAGRQSITHQPYRRRTPGLESHQAV